MPSLRIVFRAGHLEHEIVQRTPTCQQSPAQTAQRDLERYYQVLATELATVAKTLTTRQALAIADATNGTLIDVRTARMLHHEIEDALADGIADKWQIDGAKLLDTVRSWTTSQRLAVLDAIERWWMWQPAEGEEADNQPEGGYSDAYSAAAVGLTTTETAHNAVDAERTKSGKVTT